MKAVRVAPLTFLLCLAPGCREPVETCIALSTVCTPLYEPTYDEVFSRTLQKTCAQPGSACHARAGAKGGLVMEDPEETYRLLTTSKEGLPPVSSANANCSPLIVRLYSKDPDRVMPPGQPLSEAERCAIAQWVQAGALR